jgi:hypothetical protein
MTIDALTTGRVSLPRLGMILLGVTFLSMPLRIAVLRTTMIAVFQGQPPLRMRFSPTRYSTGTM